MIKKGSVKARRFKKYLKILKRLEDAMEYYTPYNIIKHGNYIYLSSIDKKEESNESKTNNGNTGY